MDITVEDTILKATAVCPMKDGEQHRGRIALHLLKGGQISFKYTKPYSPDISYKGKWILAESDPDMVYKVKIGFKSHTQDGRAVPAMTPDTVGEPEAGAEAGSFALHVEGGCDLKIRGALPSGVRYLLHGEPLTLEEHNKSLGLAEAQMQDAKQAQRRAKMCAIWAWADQDGDGFLGRHEASRWRQETSGLPMDNKAWAYFCSCLGVPAKPGIPRHKFLGPLGPYMNFPHELEDHFVKLSTKYQKMFTGLRPVRNAQVNIGVGLFGAEAQGQQIGEEDRAERVAGAFRQWDLDGNGKISQGELAQVFGRLDPSLSPIAITSLFTAIDKGKTGEIDYEEFVGWLFQNGRT